MKRSFFRTVTILGVWWVTWAASGLADEGDRSRIDARTLHQKVLCGYQGWFRCPGDGTREGWHHWSRDKNRLTSESVTVEMWPDLSEYSAEEKFPVPGWSNSKGEAASLFSSAHPKTIQRHFEWMKEYSIDGVFLQRFLVNLDRPSFDQVLGHVRKSAAKTGRVYAVCYDLSGTPPDQIEDRLTKDWKRLVDKERVTQDKQYLHHKGRPVVFVWGFFSDRFEAALAHRIIDFFHQENQYRATLVGGCQWNWRTEQNAEWAKAFRKLDVISPWNVGNVRIQEGKKWANTEYWEADMREADRHGVEYLPVVFPGFSWRNLKGPTAERDTIPRLKGKFYWRQFTEAAKLKAKMVYVAMFDEVDEATAIFKVTNHPPTQADFVTYEGLPSDWYLRLTKAGSELIRGERKPKILLPCSP